MQRVWVWVRGFGYGSEVWVKGSGSEEPLTQTSDPGWSGSGYKGLCQRVWAWVRGSVFGSEGLGRKGITGVECECRGVTWVTQVSYCQGGSQLTGFVCECQRGSQGLCKTVSRVSHGVVHESQEGS